MYDFLVIIILGGMCLAGIAWAAIDSIIRQERQQPKVRVTTPDGKTWTLYTSGQGIVEDLELALYQARAEGEWHEHRTAA